VNSECVNHTAHTWTAANGTLIPLLGEITLLTKVGGFETTVKALVSEHIAEAMLGIDWLTANRTVWEFGQSHIQIGDIFHQLRVKNRTGQWRRRVCSSSEIRS